MSQYTLVHGFANKTRPLISYTHSIVKEHFMQQTGQPYLKTGQEQFS